jgi:N6-adenosine-specific RNA methylase IME4
MSAEIQRRAAGTLRPHPQADAVPAMPADHYAVFKADVAARGVQVPLEITVGGIVLDGHERLRAVGELDIPEVDVLIVSPADELEHILLCALKRKHLGASQRAALVIELDKYRQAAASGTARARANLRNSVEVATLPPRGGKTRDLAAGWAGCSARTMQDAATVHAHDPKLFEQVKQGRLSAEVAARRVRRANRDRQLPPAPAPPEGPFELIYADPPWQLGNPDGPHAPEQHYPTMPLAKIKDLSVPAATDALLYLWAVNSHLPDALAVMAAWGFEYRANEVWVKQSIGMGVWTRNRHELLLIGRRGKASPPDPDLRLDSVVEAPRRKHSQKPCCFYERLEQLYPDRTKLELFARGKPRPGWTAWGNEVIP